MSVILFPLLKGPPRHANINVDKIFANNSQQDLEFNANYSEQWRGHPFGQVLQEKESIKIDGKRIFNSFIIEGLCYISYGKRPR